MKVVAFNGSPRKQSNTGLLIERALENIAAAGIETELVNLAGEDVAGCIACFRCIKNLDQRCAVTTDPINDCIAKMLEADGMIIGSPTYFATLNAQTKALIDRAGFVTRVNGNLLRRKVGAAVVAVRRAGALNVFQAINNFYLINEMIIPGSSYWNLGIGREFGEVNDDAEGLKTMDDLGQNMTWLLQKIKS